MWWKIFFFLNLSIYVFNFFPPQIQKLLKMDFFWSSGIIIFTIDLIALFIYSFKRKVKNTNFWQVYFFVKIFYTFYTLFILLQNLPSFIKNLINSAIYTFPSDLPLNMDIILISVVFFYFLVILSTVPFFYVVYKLGKFKKLQL